MSTIVSRWLVFIVCSVLLTLEKADAYQCPGPGYYIDGKSWTVFFKDSKMKEKIKIDGSVDTRSLKEILYKSGRCANAISEYAIDKKNVFYRGKIISGVDKGTFGVLNSEYSRDKSAFYFKGRKINSERVDQSIKNKEIVPLRVARVPVYRVSSKFVNLPLKRKSNIIYECEKGLIAGQSCPRFRYSNSAFIQNEVHIVAVSHASGHETDKNEKIIGPRTTKIFARKLDKPYELVLSSTNLVAWMVEVEPGAQIKKIHLYSNKESHLDIVGNRKIEIVKKKGFIAFGKPEFRPPTNKRFFNIDFDPDFIKSSHGDLFAKKRYDIPIRKNVTDEDFLEDFNRHLIKISTPPKNRDIPDKIDHIKGHIPEYVPSQGGYYFLMRNKLTYFDVKTKQMTEIRMDPNIKRLSHINVIKFFPPTNELFILSHWHAGENYALNVKTKKVRVFSIEQTGSFNDLVYSPKSKKLYGLMTTGFSELNENLNEVRRWHFSDEIGEAMGRRRVPRLPRNPKVRLDVHGSKVLLLIDETKKVYGEKNPQKTIDIDGIAFDVETQQFNIFIFE